MDKFKGAEWGKAVQWGMDKTNELSLGTKFHTVGDKPTHWLTLLHPPLVFSQSHCNLASPLYQATVLQVN